MATYTLNYKDGSVYTIDIDTANKDIMVSRDKAGNTRRFEIRDFGVSLKRDDVILTFFETQSDSEGDDIIGFKGLSRIVNDKEYFDDYISYTNNLGIIGQADIVVDTLLKQFLEQTRVFEADGRFQQPIYFSLSGTSPNNDPDFDNGTITITIIEDAGFTDLEARLKKGDDNWTGWQAVTDGQVITNLESASYQVQMRSAGYDLLTEPIEEITI